MKHQTIRLLFVATPLLTFSCKYDEEQICCTYLNTLVSAYVLDSTGRDMLSSEYENRILEGDINVYHEFDGSPPDYAAVTIMAPANTTDKNVLRIFLNEVHGDSDEVTQTVVKWRGMKSDTIEASFIKKAGYTDFTKLWLNGKLVWDSADSATWERKPSPNAFFTFYK